MDKDYYSSDEEVSWGPLTLREIKKTLKEPRKIERRQSDFPHSTYHTPSTSMQQDKSTSESTSAYFTPNGSVKNESEDVDTLELKNESLDEANPCQFPNELTEEVDLSDFKDEPSDVTNSPELKDEPSDVTNLPELKDVPSDVTNSPDLKDEPSGIANSDELKDESSDVTNSPELKDEPSDVAKSPELKDESSVISSSESQSPGMVNTSHLIKESSDETSSTQHQLIEPVADFEVHIGSPVRTQDFLKRMQEFIDEEKKNDELWDFITKNSDDYCLENENQTLVDETVFSPHEAEGEVDTIDPSGEEVSGEEDLAEETNLSSDKVSDYVEISDDSFDTEAGVSHVKTERQSNVKTHPTLSYIDLCSSSDEENFVEKEKENHQEEVTHASDKTDHELMRKQKEEVYQNTSRLLNAMKALFGDDIYARPSAEKKEEKTHSHSEEITDAQEKKTYKEEAESELGCDEESDNEINSMTTKPNEDVYKEETKSPSEEIDEEQENEIDDDEVESELGCEEESDNDTSSVKSEIASDETKSPSSDEKIEIESCDKESTKSTTDVQINIVDIDQEPRPSSSKSTRSESPIFNDTMEEMEMALRQGLDYVMPGEEDIIPKTPIPKSLVRVQKTTGIPQPATKKKTPSKYDYLTSPVGDYIKRKSPVPADNFKLPQKTTIKRKPQTPNVNLPTVKSLKDIVSPVSLYIKNSPKVCLKQNVPAKTVPLLTSAPGTPVVKLNKEESKPMPQVMYKPGKKIITPAKKEIVLPKSIKKMVHEPVISEHEKKAKKNLSEKFKNCDEGDLTTIDNSLLNQTEENTSFIKTRQAFIN